MPDHNPSPFPSASQPAAAAQRLVSASEVGRYEMCPLAWWYDHTHPLASASPPELDRRIAILEAVYGPGAGDLPEFQLLHHLREQSGGAAAALKPERDPLPEPVVLPRAPGRYVAIVVGIAAIIVGLMLAGIVFSLTQP